MNRRILLLLMVFCFLPGQALAAGLPEFHGFGEISYGAKVSDDKTKRDNFNLLEQRLQLKTSYMFEQGYLADKGGVLNFRGDFIVDEYYGGKTTFDLREMNFSFTPVSFMDVKLGRQVMTWGTGDYLFINDMFPKDYVAFFIGRDDEYLKKPSDALRVSLYPAQANVDVIVIPVFEPNNIAQGDRLSFFDSFQQEIAGTNSDRHLVEPAWRLSNNEYALRLYRSWGSHEFAFYFFQGRDKNPRSYQEEAARRLYYERVDVYGLSVRGPFLSGVGNMEFGYQYSRDDSDGDNRLVENTMLKALAGYTKDLGQDWKVGVQYYYEQKMNYDKYRDNLLAQDYFWDEHRHLLTQRVTKFFKSQTVMVSFFNFYSPSDHDGYIRPVIAYDITDQWKVTLGANIPWGEDDMTEFGQMKRNKNVYFRLRYNF